MFCLMSKQEYRGGQLAPLAWASVPPSGNFSSTNATAPWLPLNRNYLKNSIARKSETISRIQSLIHFRQQHFRSEAIEKHGNYLFHYINGGEIVLERYFTNERARKSDGNQDNPNRIKNNNDVIDENSDESRAMSRSSDAQRLPVASTRSRYVLFANLAKSPKSKDLRDKFHSGTILVTTSAKRMRDFLIFRSLKLDPGEAIIAQVE